MARLKLPTSPRGNHLAAFWLSIVLLTLFVGVVLLGGWRFGLGAAAQTCRVCNCTAAAAAAAVTPASNPQQAAEDELGLAHGKHVDNAAQTALGADAAGTGAADADNELLCGGPDAIPLVAASLAASTEALWPNAADAFKPWEGGFTDEDIEATGRVLGADKERADIVMRATVKDGRIVFPRQADVCDRCNGAVFLIKEGLDAGLAAGRLRIPEGLPMLWNVEDFSQCPDTPSNPCKAPLFSVFKFKQNLDVLMPHFKPRSLEPHYVPWEQKRELAFFRGASICSNVPLNGSIEAPRSANCSRWAVAQLSWEHPDLLNATIMFNVTEYGGPRAVEGPPTSHEEQAYYKYLLNVDGSTAAWRLATLLMKNSLVIKQASPDVEWYYHALKPCEHYIHYWVTHETDLISLLRKLKHPANQLTAQRIAANAQAFAYLHLGEEAQWRYWQLLIDRYIELYRPGARDKQGAGTKVDQQPQPEQQEQQAEQQQAAEPHHDQAGEPQPPTEPQQEGVAGEQQQAEPQQEGAAGEQQPPTEPQQEGVAGEQQQTEPQQEGAAGEQQQAESQQEEAAGEQQQAEPQQEEAAEEQQQAEPQQEGAAGEQQQAEPQQEKAAEEQQQAEPQQEGVAEEQQPSGVEPAGSTDPGKEERRAGGGEDQPEQHDKGREPVADEKAEALQASL